MFKHNFKYSLKILFRNKSLIFWTFIFPIILGTFFKLAFKDIENNEAFHPFDIAVIESNDFNNNEIFKEAIKSVSKSDDKLFNVKYVSKSDANKLLEDKDITGYLEFIGNDVNIKINNNGIYETILKFFVDEVNSEKNMISLSINEEVNKGNYDIDVITSNILNKLNSDVNIKNISRSNLSYTMIEYYTLIAMAALYGGILSMYIINKSMPNLSDVGKSSITPVKKSNLILSGLLASIIVQFVGLIILFLYTIFVLKINYDSNIWYIILLAIVGSIAGLSLGVFVSSIFKINENAKSGILIAITMFFSFLSGMMGITMKYVIDKNIPIINKINPAAMITDGFYSLYYYDTLNRYFFNVISLVVFSSVLLGISSIVLRRQKYDSI